MSRAHLFFNVTAFVTLAALACKEGGQKSACPGGAIRIPGGLFYMGCNPTLGSCQKDETPFHLVNVPDFEIDACEVTVADYTRCVEAGSCTRPQDLSPQCNYGKEGRESHPVNCVTFEQARDYCRWAQKDLCTEAQWEKAARGGCDLYGDCEKESRIYPWGNNDPSCATAVYQQCFCRGTCVVGSKPQGASPYGVLDMAGNVWEWVLDAYHDSYDGAPTDGSPWTDGGQNRVIRGGSFLSIPSALRVSNRSHEKVNNATDALGFRCCRWLANYSDVFDGDANPPDALPTADGAHIEASTVD